MLDGTPTTNLGGGSIFTQIPPVPLYPDPPQTVSPPYLLPGDLNYQQSNVITDIANANTMPAVVPGSPASQEILPSNRGWTLMLTRNADIGPVLLNKNSYSLDEAGHLVPYSGPNPDAPFFGKQITPTSPGATTYKYVQTGTPPVEAGPTRVATYTPNQGNPNAFGPFSFNTETVVNNRPDPNSNFGLPNEPYANTPTQLFTLTSTAHYLDYRANKGNPNGSETVMGSPNADGSNATPVGLVPYYQYDLPSSVVASTNSFATPNFGDLSVSVMNLGAGPSGPYVNPTGVDASNLALYDSSEYAATFRWGQSTGVGTLDATMASGSPFTQFSYRAGAGAGSSPTLLLRNNVKGLLQNIYTATVYSDLNAILITSYEPIATGDTIMGVINDPNQTVVKSFYAIYLPQGVPVNADTVLEVLDGSQALPGNDPPSVPMFGAGANNILVTLPTQSVGGQPVNFVVATLPNDDPSTVATFRKYAFNYITDTQSTLSFDGNNNKVNVGLSITTQNVDAASTAPGALLVTYAHQYKNLAQSTYGSLYLTDPSTPGSPLLTLPSISGTTRFLAAPTTTTNGISTSTIGYSLQYDGSLSILPIGAFVSTDPNDKPYASAADLELLTQLITERYQDIDPTNVYLNNGQGNAYVWGQDLNSVAQIVAIADGLGLTAQRDQLLALLKAQLTTWFTASKTLNAYGPQQQFGYDPAFGNRQFLHYDSTWDGLFVPDGFVPNDGLTDLQYLWGYWIRVASVVGTYDPSFVAGFGPMISTQIRNVASWDRNDSMFPYLRVFNVYDGHSYAGGVYPVGDGNNEESASEALNLYSAIIDWGSLVMAGAQVQNPSDPDYVLGQTIRDLGIGLHTLEHESFRQYWLDVDSDTLPKLLFVTYDGNTYGAGGYVQRYSYGSTGLQEQPDGTFKKIDIVVNPPSQWQNEIYASNQFLMLRGLQTFFVGADASTANNAESHYAITTLPFTPASLYLGRDVHYQIGTDGTNPIYRNVVQENYDRYISDQNAVYGAPVAGQLRLLPNGKPITQGGTGYTGSLLLYQSLFDPQGALGRWNGVGNYRLNFPASATPAQKASDDYTHYAYNMSESLPTTFAFMNFFAKYGQVRGDVWGIGATATAVLDTPHALATDAYVRTYIVQNVSGTPLANVSFSDGHTVTIVPARSVYAISVPINQPAGSSLKTVTNTYNIPDLSGKAPTSPEGGTNLYLSYTNTPIPGGPNGGPTYPLTQSPPTNPGLVSIASVDPTGASNAQYAYPFATPFVLSTNPTAPLGFPGTVLSSNSTVASFQIPNVSGAYDPAKGLHTKLRLTMKVPRGSVNNTGQGSGSTLLVGAQVRYDLHDAQGTSIVETYPLVTYNNIGGMITYTDELLGVITSLPSLGSGVAAATRTYGDPIRIDPNLHFAFYDSSSGSKNLLDPNYDKTPLDRRIQLSDQSFTMANGTVTVSVYIAQFTQNQTSFVSPSIEFITGLPGYQGLESFISIPMTGVTVGDRIDTSLGLTTPQSVFAGEMFQLSATARPQPSSAISAAATSVPTGLVRFFNGSTFLGESSLVDGVARLTTSVSAGFASLRAVYLGDSTFDDATSETDTLPAGTFEVQGANVTVKNADGTVRYATRPFGARVRGGFDISPGDMTGDGISDLAISRGQGNSPVVRVLLGQDGRVASQFLAAPARAVSGVNVETGTLNADQYDDIVAATGSGLSVYNGRARRVVRTSHPFGLRSVITSLTLQDLNGDGLDDITVTGVRAGQTLTRSFDGRTGTPLGTTLRRLPPR